MPITLTFAGDEAGDVSFAFRQGASRHFVVAVIATPLPDKLRKLLEDVRKDSGLRADYEFRFHMLSSAQLRMRVLGALSQADFESWALVTDKTMLPDAFKVMRGLDFYLYFVSELIRLIPSAKREGATLILDEFGSPKIVRAELRRVLSMRDISRHFGRIVVKRSRSESLIQIADLVAGAVLRRDAKNDAEAYEALEPRIKRVFEYPG